MKRLHLMWLPILGILFGTCIVSNPLPAQQTPSDTVPASMVVSVEARHGKDIPAITNKEDVRVLEGKERLHVTDWIPLQGSQAGLELRGIGGRKGRRRSRRIETDALVGRPLPDAGEVGWRASRLRMDHR